MRYNYPMPDSSDKVLNPEQIEAIEYGEGPLLIIAGAGTGKTTVVTERIKYLITQKNISPSEILALTFTEKAAREMETRVDEALPLGYANMWISTFHSFGDRILRDEALNIGLDPKYKLMTEAESVQLFRKNLFRFDLEYFRPLGNPTKFIDGMLQHFSRLKDEDVSPLDYQKFMEGLGETEEEEKNRYKELVNAYRAYEEIKTKESLVDFADLISNVLKLFRTRPKILSNYKDKFKYILIDEFQDTNYAQYALIKLLAPPPKSNLTVVADDNQSIYRFRGAAVSNVLQFIKDYPEAKNVVLNQNYRSTQTILDNSYRLIKNNDPDTLEATMGISKKLKKTREVEEKTVEFLMSERVEDEAETVAQKIQELSDTYSYKDFAILVRANNHADPFIKELARKGIPYQFLGPGMLFRQPEVKDLIAYLSVLYNYEDNVAIYRLLSMEFFEISGRELATLLNFSKKLNLSLFETCEKTVENNGDLTVVGKSLSKPEIGEKTLKTLTNLITMVHRHMELAKKDTAGQILYYFLEDTGLIKTLTDYKTVKDEKKVQNIAKFFDKLKTYEVEHEDASVYAVVDFINLSMELGESPLAADTDWTENDAVNILTAHSAKGLEFPVVFLVNLVDRRFPTTERREQIPIPDSLIKEILPKGDYHLEEERRLFYVGMTRAKDRLFLTAASFYGEGKREKKISPFVAEALGEKIVQSSKCKVQSDQLSIFDFKPSPEIQDTKYKIQNTPVNYLSYSQIDTFNTCPLQYKYRYILRIPTPPSAALSFGDTIHQTMRDFYQRAIAGQIPQKEDLLQILAENWSSLGYPSKAHEEKYKKEGEKILSEFFDKSYDPKSLPISLEQVFSIRIDGNLKIGGRIDRIDRVKRDCGKDEYGIEIIDYKTGKSPTKKDVGKDLQMTVYAMAAVDGTLTYMGLLEKIPKPEEVKISFYFFDNQEKISSFRKRGDFEAVKEELLQKAVDISKSDFSPTPGKHCDFCEFKLICEAWN